MHGPEAFELNVDGKHLEAVWIGPPPDVAPTLIFLHEGLGCVAMWKDFPQRLAAATGCGALVYSRGGYGGSDSVALPRPLTYMHDEALTVLPQVLKVAGVERAVLVGHSDGGSIALIHAGAAAGSTVVALVLMAPHVFNEDVSVASIEAARRAYAEGGLRGGLAKYHGDNVDTAFWGWNDAWLDPGFRSWNLEEYLPGIRIPVLLMQGEGDEYGSAAQIETIADGVDGPVTIRWLADCGHAAHRDQPQTVIETGAAFLSKHSNFNKQVVI